MEILTNLPPGTLTSHQRSEKMRCYIHLEQAELHERKRVEARRGQTHGKFSSSAQCGFAAVCFIMFHNSHVYNYSFTCTQCYFFKKTSQYRYISKNHIFGGWGRSRAWLTQFPQERKWRLMTEMTLSGFTTGSITMARINFSSRREAFPTNQTSKIRFLHLYLFKRNVYF